MRFLNKKMLLSYVFVEGLAFGGSITSSGGNIFDDSKNPWFLENTAVVQYCVDWDRGAFHADENTLHEAIDGAFAAWKRTVDPVQQGEISDWERAQPYGRVRLATQRFVRQVNCDGNTDIRFQLGTLSEDQKKYLGDPKAYVGAAVRTEYDLQAMRAKGFIYLAADTGSLRPSDGNFAANPWVVSDGFALRAVLAHEVGHIFGFDHDTKTFLMDAKTPYLITSQTVLDNLEKHPDEKVRIESDVKPDGTLQFSYDYVYDDCSYPEGAPHFAAQFFGALPDDQCLRLHFKSKRQAGLRTRDLSVEVYAKADKNAEWKPVTQLLKKTMQGGESRYGIALRVPEQQKVFTSLPSDLTFFRSLYLMEGFAYEAYDMSFAYDANKTLVLRLMPDNRFEMAAVIDGKLHYQYFKN